MRTTRPARESRGHRDDRGRGKAFDSGRTGGGGTGTPNSGWSTKRGGAIAPVALLRRATRWASGGPKGALGAKRIPRATDPKGGELQTAGVERVPFRQRAEGEASLDGMHVRWRTCLRSVPSVAWPLLHSLSPPPVVWRCWELRWPPWWWEWWW